MKSKFRDQFNHSGWSLNDVTGTRFLSHINISRTWGVKPAELTASQILQTDSTDYLMNGKLMMKNGRIDKYLFDGGYAKATPSGSSSDSFSFYYYNQDHLGNVREVVDGSGNILQVTNYYPFGAPYFDASSTKNANMQPYKYNGKELDRMHGLNTYDYGARQYDPILARWDRIDPLCEKYYSVSPYAYCANNPIMRIDIDGLYDFEGINNWSNPIIAVFPNAEQRDKTIQLDYQNAQNASVPIITVENIADFGAALSDLKQKGIPYESIAINSHGSFQGFNIGSEEVNMMTDLNGLSEGLKDKKLFVGACNVGKNELLVNQIAEDTQSTVIAPRHKLPAGYQYDGSNYLNTLGESYIPTYSPAQYFISNGNTSTTVTNVSIDKNNGIKWDGMSPFKF